MKVRYGNIELPNQKWWVKNHKVRPFDLDIPIFDTEESKGKRLLLVIDRVSNEDIGIRKLLGGKGNQVLFNVLDHVKLPIKELAAINLHCFRIKSLTDQGQQQALKEFWKRVMDYAKKFNPDCIVLCGNESIRLAWPKSKSDPMFYLGRQKTLKYRGHKYKCVPSLPYMDLSTVVPEKMKTLPSLIGEFSHHLDVAVNGNRYAIEYPYKSILVDSIKKFDKFMIKLKKAKTPCWDTEFTNGFGETSKLLSIQCATNHKRVYFIPFYHRETPFTAKELDYIKLKLKHYFEYHKCDYWIAHYGQAEMKVFRAQLGVRYIESPLYDTIGAEFSLDENRKFISDIYPFFKIKPHTTYALITLTYKYGSDAYSKGAIDKEDRFDMEKYSLKDTMEYGCKDSIYTYRIHDCQIAEAKRRGYYGFIKTQTHLIHSITSVFAAMEYNGAPVDKQYLIKMMGKDSEFTQALAGIKAKYKTSKYAIKANKMMLKHKAPGDSIFGDPWVFDIAKQESQQTLFFDVMKLKPINENTKGGSVNKAFQVEYAGVPEVDLLSQYNKNTKLRSTFIKSHLERLNEEGRQDKDNVIRAWYDYRDVLTGRSSAKKPNLQQIPSRGPLSKLVKRQFIAPPGWILIKVDFRAHEVAQWGNISNDKKLASSIGKGAKIRRAIRIMDYKYGLQEWFNKWVEDKYWFVKKDDENFKKKPTPQQKQKQVNKLSGKKQTFAQLQLNNEIYGDPHRINYNFFFGVPTTDVSDDQRQNVKSVVFGTMYGKQSRSLAYDIRAKEMGEIDRQARKMVGMDEDQLNAWKERKKKPYYKEAQDLIDKLFDTFEEGGKWIKKTHEKGRSTFLLQSPFYRQRHMWGYMHQNRTAWAAQDRRGPNSIVQGTSSDMAYIGGRCLQRLIWERYHSKGKEFSLRQNNAVHDSSELMCKLEDLPESLYLIEHAMTTAVHIECREVYGFKLNIALEIEAEIGFALSNMDKWDFTEHKLFKILEKQKPFAIKELGHRFKNKTDLKIRKRWNSVKLKRLAELQQVDVVERTSIWK